MSGLLLPEGTLRLLEKHIRENFKANADAYIAELPAAQRRTAFVPPKDFYIGEVHNIISTPCVFMLPDEVDLMKPERGQNYINANVNIYLAIVVSEKDAELVALMSYRYFAVMVMTLGRETGVTLHSENGDITLKVKVMSGKFSPIYTADDKNNSKGDFRKECSLYLEINHWEAQ